MKDCKTKCTRKADDVEKALYMWFADTGAQDVPVTTLILEKARQFATALDKPNFKVSNAWLCHWKTRNSIRYKKAGKRMMPIMNLLKCGLLLCSLRCWRNLMYKTSTMLRKQEFTIKLFLTALEHWQQKG